MPANQPQDQKESDYHDRIAFAIIGAGLANAITLLQPNGPFTLWNTIVGIIILSILHAYRPRPPFHFSLYLAYAATWSISFPTTFGVVYNMIYSFCGGPIPAYSSKQTSPFPFAKTGIYTPFNAYDVTFFLVWIVTFLLFLLYFTYFAEKKLAPSTSDADSAS